MFCGLFGFTSSRSVAMSSSIRVIDLSGSPASKSIDLDILGVLASGDVAQILSSWTSVFSHGSCSSGLAGSPRSAFTNAATESATRTTTQSCQTLLPKWCGRHRLLVQTWPRDSVDRSIRSWEICMILAESWCRTKAKSGPWMKEEVLTQIGCKLCNLFLQSS